LDTAWSNNWSFTNNTIKFLYEHRACRVGIRDEYGSTYALEQEEVNP